MEAVKNGAVPKITVITIIDIMTKATKRVIRRTKTVTKTAIARKTGIVKTVTEAAKNVMKVIIIKVTNIVEIVVTIKAAVHRQALKTRTKTKRPKKSPNLKIWRPK